MKIAIISAMSQETVFLITKLNHPNLNRNNGYLFYEGFYAGHELIVVQGGVGKTAAGMLVASLNLLYPKLDKIINVGVAGGVSGKTAIGDIVVNQQAVYGDVDITLGGKYVFGQMSNCPPAFSADPDMLGKITSRLQLPYVLGSVITSDKFVIDADFTNRLVADHFSKLNVCCFDMESAAFAHACLFYQKPFLSIRAISDVIGENQHTEFEDNLESACLNSNLFVLGLLEIL
jgi:adenosylhomocysteine nucleosidase